MKTILETTQLEFDKSDFLIDLVEHDNGKLYIEIVQTILNSIKEYIDIINLIKFLIPQVLLSMHLEQEVVG